MLVLEAVFGQALRVSAPNLRQRRFGVPIGGPFDAESYRLCLALLGLSAPESEVWEVAGSAQFRSTMAGTYSLVGHANHANVRNPIANNETVSIDAGRKGARSYLGFIPEHRLPARLAELPDSLFPRPIRILPGPHAWTDQGRFHSQTWQVAADSNRQGLRLHGEFTTHTVELPSEPTVRSSIQLTPSGMPIILGPDGPTIGGYPQVAVVASIDQDRLGQLAIGDFVTFELITLEEARSQFLIQRERQRKRELAISWT